MSPPSSLAFSELFAQAIAEWPAEMPSDVRFLNGEGRTRYMVEGLIDLEDDMSDRHIGSPSEVLLRNLHQAITIRIHAVAPEVAVVRPATLEPRAVKAAFDGLLGRLFDADAGWTEADKALVDSYFAANRAHAA